MRFAEYLSERNDNHTAAVMTDKITNGRGSGSSSVFGKKKKKGQGDSEEEAPK